MIDNSCKPKGIILDIFAGSGSTLIAAHHSGKTARLVELDPRYVDVICRRWEQHTGITPTRDGQEVTFL
jgi:site-specific DNA-methyltransferase (adenine-specific)